MYVVPCTLMVIHLTLVKSPGNNINDNTRAIKILSGFYRDMTKLDNRLLQEWIGAMVFGRKANGRLERVQCCAHENDGHGHHVASDEKGHVHGAADDGHTGNI